MNKWPTLFKLCRLWDQGKISRSSRVSLRGVCVIYLTPLFGAYCYCLLDYRSEVCRVVASRNDLLTDKCTDWKTESTMVAVKSYPGMCSLCWRIVRRTFVGYGWECIPLIEALHHGRGIQTLMGPEYHCTDCLMPLNPSLISLPQIARVNGSSQTDDRIVIIGAHQDRQAICQYDMIILITWTAPISGRSSQPQVSIDQAVVGCCKHLFRCWRRRLWHGYYPWVLSCTSGIWFCARETSRVPLVFRRSKFYCRATKLEPYILCRKVGCLDHKQ